MREVKEILEFEKIVTRSGNCQGMLKIQEKFSHNRLSVASEPCYILL